MKTTSKKPLFDITIESPVDQKDYEKMVEKYALETFKKVRGPKSLGVALLTIGLMHTRHAHGSFIIPGTYRIHGNIYKVTKVKYFVSRKTNY